MTTRPKVYLKDFKNFVTQFFLNDAISGRDQALERLNLQVEELADLLALERRASENLRNNVTQLSSELQSTLAARDGLEDDLSEFRNKHAALGESLRDAEGKLSKSDEERARLRLRLELGRDTELGVLLLQFRPQARHVAREALELRLRGGHGVRGTRGRLVGSIARVCLLYTSPSPRDS